MTHISANDLKTKGISAIEFALSTAPEAVVSVRGKDRFVVMDIAHYHYLRECELDAALAQSNADMTAGRYVVESVPQHMARLEAMLATDGKPAKAVRAKQPAASKPRKTGRRRASTV